MNFDTDFRMLIDGKLVEGDATFPVVNPATGEAFAAAPDCSAEGLDAAVAAARRAFPGWRDLASDARALCLRAAADVLEANAEGLSRLLTREQGRPVSATPGEMIGSAAWLRAYAAMSPPVHRLEADGQIVETSYAPLGVVCAISPWNVPVALSFWKIAPALAAGNTIILKPSPYTPLTMLKIAELLRDTFPAGVLNIISGSDELGPKMTAHPGFAKITFTGSTATGKRVMASAAADLKRVTLELGGNDAAIVLPDVDVDEVAQKIFFSAFFNSAQVCIATKRLYVHDSVYDALFERLAAIAHETPLGDGAEQGTVLGPVQNRRQFERVTGLIEQARAEGLSLVQGHAGPGGNGYFIPVTLVDNPPEDAAVVQEEAFGPILPLMRFTDLDAVVGLVNATDYGLGGTVWSGDVEKGIAIARRLETGNVWVNQNQTLRPDTPFAGHKQSGVGVENGLEGMLEYMVPQCIYVPA